LNTGKSGSKLINFLNASERKNSDGERCPSVEMNEKHLCFFSLVKKGEIQSFWRHVLLFRQVKRNKSISGGKSRYIVPCPWLGVRELQRFVVQLQRTR